MKIHFIILVLFSQTIGILCQANNYLANIFFVVHKEGVTSFNSTFDNNATLLATCDPTEPYTIIVHGWTETQTTPWASSMISSYLSRRGGCVFWMDYSYYTLMAYGALFNNFNGINSILTRKLQQLEQLGFIPANGLLFGFSFGSHVALESSYKYGVKKIGRIDACDPAGPQFGLTSPSVIHAKDAAKAVQCIHTSGDFGTLLRFCQKSIDMGRCGTFQPAGGYDIGANHRMCPTFYLNAFNYDFKLVPKATVNSYYSTSCVSKQTTPDVTLFSTPAKMGYYLDMTIPDGEYYSLTNNVWPYNVA